jgi:hypothetical protein
MSNSKIELDDTVMVMTGDIELDDTVMVSPDEFESETPTKVIPYETNEELYFSNGHSPIGPERPTLNMRPVSVSDGVPDYTDSEITKRIEK